MRIPHLAVALDTSDWSEFEGWCDRFGPRAEVLKIGLEAYVRWGPAAVERARDSGAEIFLDLKLHDIPNTVAGAVRSAADQGVGYLTVHASGGARMLEAAASAADNRVKILAVTLLTHLDENDLERLDLGGSAASRVLLWAQLAQASGCAGIVCSPLEVGGLRRRLARPFILVTPGIRFESPSANDDQRRVASPEQALSDGSDLLVVGRPITGSAEPDGVLDQLAAAATR